MMRRLPLVALLGAWVLAACGCINLGLFAPPRLEEVVVRESPRWFEPNRVALIDVSGIIGSDVGFLATGTTVADVKEKLERAAGDHRVKAIVLRIDSPGGEVTASDAICEEVRRFRDETGKPVVAMLMGTAASGGYYVALSADCIVASPTTVTGSVGVVMQLLNVEGLLGKLGLRSEVIKTGEKKDIGSPMRTMTEEERALLAGVTQAMFQRFLSAVRAARPGMTDADAATLSDGRILTAQQALELHVVDRIGYLDSSLDEAIALARVRNADVILYRAFADYRSNIYALGPGGLLEQGLGGLLGRPGPRFLYLWTPGE